MSVGSIMLTRADHGRRMTWDEYLHTEAEQGLSFELGRGVLAMNDVPGWSHGEAVDGVRSQFYLYRDQHPRRIRFVAAGSDCRLLIPGLLSDRHPDVAIYTTDPPKGVPADEFWSSWIPAVVIEVVSLSSIVRDYEEKPDEYLEFGVGEYWIIDPEKREMLVHKRVRGRWKKTVVRPGDTCRPASLPGFEFDLAAALDGGPISG